MGKELGYGAGQALVPISGLAGRESIVLEREARVFFRDRNVLGEIPFKPGYKEVAGASTPDLPAASASKAGSALISLATEDSSANKSSSCFSVSERKKKARKGKIAALKRAVNIFTVRKGYLQHIWVGF